MTSLSLIVLDVSKVGLPYKISSSLEEASVSNPSIRGYGIQQRKGTTYLVRNIELSFLGLTPEEFDALQEIFSILDPFTVYSAQLHRTEPYLLGKPRTYSFKEYNTKQYPTLVKAYDIQVSFRILK